MEKEHVDVSKCTSHYDVYTVTHFLDVEKPTESGLYEVEEANEHVNDLMGDGRYQEAEEVAQANADLVREAFEVAHAISLSPRQLVEQRRELLLVLFQVTKAFREHLNEQAAEKGVPVEKLCPCHEELRGSENLLSRHGM